MKKVFISVPMSGKDDKVIERAIQVTKARYLHATEQNVKDVEFYDNFHGCRNIQPDIKIPALAYLGKAIMELGDCDIIVFGQDWQKARGCQIEHEVALDYGIERFYPAWDMN